jgi:hypothetical protein
LARLAAEECAEVRNMADTFRFIMECRLCSFRQAVDVSEGIRSSMTEKDVTASLAGEAIRAEERFFQGHWVNTHPAEAKEISYHLEQVANLARVTTYQKRVLDGRFEGS